MEISRRPTNRELSAVSGITRYVRSRGYNRWDGLDAVRYTVTVPEDRKKYPVQSIDDIRAPGETSGHCNLQLSLFLAAVRRSLYVMGFVWAPNL